jgi:L-asparaginase II
MAAVPMIELWRGGLLESRHRGHAVIFGPGGVEAVWGDADAVIFPRSSCKMIQALPLVESGAADAAELTDAHLALACASHSGAAVHTDMVRDWLGGLGLTDDDLRCGAHMPSDILARDRLIRVSRGPCQYHNNCSGKHTGFLTLARQMKGGPEYTEIDHPLQTAIRVVTEEVTDMAVAGHGIDGCSAPNFATTVTGLARAMARFAAANPDGGTRDRAMARLTSAMRAHPVLVAGPGKACTDLMSAMGGRVAVKYGAEAVYTAILPDQKRGIAVKIEDGGTRAVEAAVTALLVRLGALEAAHPAVAKYLTGPQKNWRGIETSGFRVAESFA